jgi:rhodanese-related sulfurtransferase
MGKYTRSAKEARKKQNLVIGFVLALIILVIGAVVILPRISGDGDSGSDLLVKNQEVTVEEAYQLYEDGVYTLDVRTAEEYQAGHIPGSVLIPLDELALRAGELPVGEPILIYCRSGNRSLEAMNLLAGAGFMNLSSMDGGFNDWVAAGYPAEK